MVDNPTTSVDNPTTSVITFNKKEINKTIKKQLLSEQINKIQLYAIYKKSTTNINTLIGKK